MVEERRAKARPAREGKPASRDACGSGFRRTLLMLALATAATPAPAGPVEVYREGDRHCPRNVAPGSPRIDQKEAERIALKLVPDDFCGPSASIAGCDVVTENFYDSWRVYVHQYHRRPNAKDWAALTHTYVILDPIGNCLANIPGTEPGAPR